MSTSRSASGSPTSKKLSSCVRPGVFEVRASPLRLVSALSSEDLPTLERPAKAISGQSGSGRNLSAGADFRNVDRPGKQLPGALGELVVLRPAATSGRRRMRVGGVQRRSVL